MSISVMTLVWKGSRCKGGPLLVLLAIADCANDDGEAYPSEAHLAAKARMTDRNVRYSIDYLKARGELMVRAGAGPKGVNLYQVRVENFSSLEMFAPRKNTTKRGGSRLPPDPSVVSNSNSDPSDQRHSRGPIKDWFEREFIPAYPKHRQVQHKTAWARLKELHPDEQRRTQILESVEVWKASWEWTRENGDYVPGMGKFFADRWFEKTPQPRASAAHRLSPGMETMREIGKEVIKNGRGTGNGGPQESQSQLVSPADRRGDRR